MINSFHFQFVTIFSIDHLSYRTVLNHLNIMPPAATPQFRLYLKSASNMKLNTNASVTRILYEGITSFISLGDFDADSIKTMARNCRETIPAIAADQDAGILVDEPEVAGTVISTQSMVRLTVACNATKYYLSINRVPTVANLHYQNILASFKIEFEAYEKLQKEDSPDIPSIKDSDNERKVIKWAPIFMDCMSRTYGIKGPLAYVLRDEVDVVPEADDPLQEGSYYGRSGGLQTELIARLSHDDALFRSDNKTVYSKLEKACRGSSVESTIKTFSHAQNGRGAYAALIDHHAGASKYRAISKKRMNLLQQIKWNGRNYSLEKHVSNHRQAVDDLNDCAQHITVAVPDASQRVEYLIDSINCPDSTLQAAIGLIRSDVNGMRADFELAANALIEVDPYRRTQRQQPKPTAQVAAIDFGSGRGDSGVDLRWHTPTEFRALTQEQRSELVSWQRTPDGKSQLKKSRDDYMKSNKRKSDNKGDNKTGKDNEAVNKKRKQWLKSYVKKPSGLKHVMGVLAREENSNAAFVSSLNSAQLPPATQTAPPVPPPAQQPSVGSLNARFPGSATRVQLNSILKHNPNSNKK
jgi:hypothetical protein